jgi:hypothetical protein
MARARHELKYMITEAQAAALTERIRPYVRPDRHSASGEYPLVSLYLDSDDLRLCRESLEGVKNRYKLRIRSYREDADAPCFFEIKRRVNQVIIKSRACVPQRAMGAFMCGAGRSAQIRLSERRDLDQFLFYRQQIAARPVVRVRYLRRAYESRFDDDVRVTFDRRICGSVTRVPLLGSDGGGWHYLPGGGVVLEIKFTRGYPSWVNGLVRDFGLQAESISKYARLLTHMCALRFCAPAMRRGAMNEPTVAFS